jgi:hypothetical protein
MATSDIPGDITDQFRQVSSINNHTFSNLYYDPNNCKFYKKGKKKIVIEVDDFKPIRWCKVQNNYTLKNGETAKYDYTYINLLSDEKNLVRINADDWTKRDKVETDEKGVAYKI